LLLTLKKKFVSRLFQIIKFKVQTANLTMCVAKTNKMSLRSFRNWVFENKGDADG